MSEWNYKSLGDPNYFKVIMGQSPPSSTYNDEGQGLPFYQGKAEFGLIYPSARTYCTNPSRIAEKDDILISVRAPVGPTNMVYERCSIGRGLAAIRCKSVVLPKFLLYALRAIEREITDSVRDQGGGFTSIKRDQLKMLKVPVLNIDEQHRIVARIEELTFRAEEARSARQKARTQISTLFFLRRREVYQSLLSDFPSKPLGKCGKVVGGGTPSKSRGDYWHGDIPWIAPKEMKSFRIAGSSEQITETAVSESSATLIPAPAVLFVVRGMILARYIPVGVSDVPCTINQDMKTIVPNEDILADYLAHMLLGANDILLNMVETAGHGTKKLETAAWSSLDIPAPNIQTQKAVIEELTDFQEKLAELESLQRETEKALATFQSALLAKAFRGEL